MLMCNFAFSQGLLNNGAQIVLNSTAQVVIDGNGNWTNNGTVTCVVKVKGTSFSESLRN